MQRHFSFGIEWRANAGRGLTGRFALADQFAAQRRSHGALVLRRVEDVPDQVAEIGVGHLFKAFGHDRHFAHAQFRDVGPGHYFLLRPGREEFHARFGLLDQPSVDQAAILGFDFHVLIAFADDLVWVDDVGQKRVERGATHAGEVRADFGAFTVHFVADETYSPGDFVAGVDVRLAAQDDLPLPGDEFEFVGVGSAEPADGVGGARAD